MLWNVSGHFATSTCWILLVQWHAIHDFASHQPRMSQLFFPALGASLGGLGGHDHPMAIATEVTAPAAGWRVPWYFDCRHNSEWRRSEGWAQHGDHGAVPVATEDTLQDSPGSAWGCLPGDGTWWNYDTWSKCMKMIEGSTLIIIIIIFWETSRWSWNRFLWSQYHFWGSRRTAISRFDGARSSCQEEVFWWSQALLERTAYDVIHLKIASVGEISLLWPCPKG